MAEESNLTKLAQLEQLEKLNKFEQEMIEFNNYGSRCLIEEENRSKIK
jgi:hypothetical protein